MTIKYFKDIKTQQELRKAFIVLLKKYHPDNGGDAEICKIINAEYEYLLKRLPKSNANDSGTGEQTATEQEKKAAADFDKLIRELISKIIHMDGLNIEVVGTWIWVDGDSYKWKDELKAAGFQWSRARKKWHANPYGDGTWHRGRRDTFDNLRQRYGSTIIDTDPRPALS